MCRGPLPCRCLCERRSRVFFMRLVRCFSSHTRWAGSSDGWTASAATPPPLVFPSGVRFGVHFCLCLCRSSFVWSPLGVGARCAGALRRDRPPAWCTLRARRPEANTQRAMRHRCRGRAARQRFFLNEGGTPLATGAFRDRSCGHCAVAFGGGRPVPAPCLHLADRALGRAYRNALVLARRLECSIQGARHEHPHAG